jgi:2-oxoglutarate ferredoxin oxidoreductase subunit beta
MPTLDDYKGQTPAWCPGCGNFFILETFKKALVELDINPHEIAIVSGIGQGAKLPHYTQCNTFNGLHGRTMPVATGLKLVNHNLHVIAVAGDGDCYGEGGNHLMAAMRRNINVSLFVHNNQIYGLTKGQASPTSQEGLVTKTQPFGTPSEALNPVALAVALDCSFVARGFAGDKDYLQHLMQEAIRHKGFSLVDILQPCVIFNRINTYQWYRDRVYHIEDDYNPYDRLKAFERALEWGARIPLGIIYKNDRMTMEDRFSVIQQTPLVNQGFNLEGCKKELESFY